VAAAPTPPAPVVVEFKAPVAAPAAPAVSPAKATASAPTTPVAAKGKAISKSSTKAATPKAIAAANVPPPAGIVVADAPDPAKPNAVRVRIVTAETLRKENPLELANQSKSPTLLGAVTASLAAQGYRVEAVKESAKKRAKTVILYREGALQPAYQVAQTFPGYQEMKQTEAFDKNDSKVRVLLGRDMEAHRKSFAATTAAR
jgi:hypothetical protein